MKKWKILIILFMCFRFLGTLAFAEPMNSLRIYKLINEKNKDFVLPEIGVQGRPNFNLGSGIKPIANSEITIYFVENKDKSFYDKLSLKELGKPYEKGNTDKDGMVYFSSLPNGYYYVRDLSTKDYVGTSILIQLPHQVEGKKIQDVILYLKSTLPDTPPQEETEDSSDKPIKDFNEPESLDPSEEPQEGLPSPSETPEQPVSPSNPGRRFIKTDNSAKKNPLSGATFKVVKKEKNQYVPVLKNGLEYVVSSDKEGKFHVDGIGLGTFYLVETIAPKDKEYTYKLLNRPLPFELKDDSLIFAPIRIENAPGEVKKNLSEPPIQNKSSGKAKSSKSIQIPKTGDIEFIMYFIGGGAFFTLGLYLYIIEEKKRELWH